MERVIGTIDSFCTFPALEKRKLVLRVLFCFLVGNEDMHLKNLSLLTRPGAIALSPAYDLLNSSIVLRDPIEEVALPILGKKNNLTRTDLTIYFCSERCRLSPVILQQLLENLEQAAATWPEMIRRSFLSQQMREKYLHLLAQRRERLFG